MSVEAFSNFNRGAATNDTSPPPPEFLLTHTRAEPPRWTCPRTRFQMVSDVAEGLPDGSHDSSYIYALWCIYARLAGASSLASAQRLTRRHGNRRPGWLLIGSPGQLVGPALSWSPHLCRQLTTRRRNNGNIMNINEEKHTCSS